MRVDVDAGLDELGGHQVRARAGVLVHEAPGVGHEPDVERLGDLRRRLTPSSRIRSHTISAVHDASSTTWLTVPKRVLSWWWSMLRMCVVLAP